MYTCAHIQYFVNVCSCVGASNSLKQWKYFASFIWIFKTITFCCWNLLMNKSLESDINFYSKHPLEKKSLWDSCTTSTCVRAELQVLCDMITVSSDFVGKEKWAVDIIVFWVWFKMHCSMNNFLKYDLPTQSYSCHHLDSFAYNLLIRTETTLPKVRMTFSPHVAHYHIMHGSSVKHVNVSTSTC